METNSGKNEGMEMSISIKDMLMRVCLKWRAMIVWAIVFAILFNGLAVMKEYRAIQVENDLIQMTETEKKESKIKAAEANAESYKSALSEREIVEVEKAANAYLDLMEYYNNALDYSYKSIKMQIDPNCIPTVELQYSVDTHYKVEYPEINVKDYTASILDSFDQGIRTDAVYKQIAETMGDDVDAAYIAELLTTNITDNNITFKIIARDRQECEGAAEILKSEVNKCDASLKKMYGNYDLLLITENYTENADATVLTSQTAQATTITNSKNAVVYLTNGMTEKQKNYYYAYADWKKLLAGDEEISDEVMDEIDHTNISMSPSLVHNKMILLGFLAGIFLCFIWYIILYLLSGKLRMADGVEGYFNGNILGFIPKKTKSRIDSCIKRLFNSKYEISQKDSVEMISSTIKILAQKNHINNIFITTTSHDNRVNQIINEIQEKLKTNIEVVNVGNSIIYSVDSYEKMAISQGVVLIEVEGVSTYDDIKNVVYKIRGNGVSILGGVVIE
ncbi:hypothetical protein KQI22_01765 [Kineothrix sp. MSJ-39]|uniref:hypothetical protein n=1 Tax=Kineothrix sp. MSJ-39 TaxID=2841533 RepID=UPI001C0FA550|nr:hypothetical protein [Kineothrix sp. MSJ-39]MBU5428793.1 hypothetical protein [Kineothrix sp. MSJ-39]